MILAVTAAFLAAAPASEPVKTAQKDPMVCTSETPVGTRLPVRVCMRKSERDRLQRDSRTSLEEIQAKSKGPIKTNE